MIVEFDDGSKFSVDEKQKNWQLIVTDKEGIAGIEIITRDNVGKTITQLNEGLRFANADIVFTCG
jgi:hypothetical protein